MKHEFTKIKSDNETRYVLETASAGGTGAGAVASVSQPLGAVQRRTREETVKVPVTQKPRQGVLKTQTGAGQHRDKKKEQKQGKEKHRKPFAEQDVDESGLQYYTGVKKHGKEYMVKAAQAARDGASQKELGALKDKYSKAYKEGAGISKDKETDFHAKLDKLVHNTFGKRKGEMEGHDNPDHEISMASNELVSIIEDAMRLLKLVRRYSEMEGLEAWQQSKITKAADYLNAVLNNLQGDAMMHKEDHSNFGNGWGQGSYDTYVGGNHGRGVAEGMDSLTFWKQQAQKAGGAANIDWYAIGIEHGKQGIVMNPPYGVGAKAVNMYSKGLDAGKQGVAEATGDTKFDRMLGNIVKDTPMDFVLSDPHSGVLFKRGFKSREEAQKYNKEKEGGFYSVYSYQWWRDTIEPEIPDFYRKKGVAEGSINEGQYEMMLRNGQVKKFIAKDDADAKRIAAGHGAKSVIKMKGNVPAGKVSEQCAAEELDSFAERKVLDMIDYIKSEYPNLDQDEFGDKLWMYLDAEFGNRFAHRILDHDLDKYWDIYSEREMAETDAYMESLANTLESLISEKAVSKAQQKFMGMVHAVQKGEMPAPSKAVAKAAKGMSMKAGHEYAATKHKGLPDKKSKK